MTHSISKRAKFFIQIIFYKSYSKITKQNLDKSEKFSLHFSKYKFKNVHWYTILKLSNKRVNLHHPN